MLSADQPLGSLKKRTPTDFEVETLDCIKGLLEWFHVVATVSSLSDSGPDVEIVSILIVGSLRRLIFVVSVERYMV